MKKRLLLLSVLYNIVASLSSLLNTVAYQIQTQHSRKVFRTRSKTFLAFSTSSTPDQEDEVQRLKRQAEQLRQEVESFEKQKQAVKQKELEQLQQQLAAKEAYLDRYSAVIPILKPDGSTVEEKVQFLPRIRRNIQENEQDQDTVPLSFITVCQANLPLGIILGESEDVLMVTVDEVAEGGHGQLAGILPGDIVRACTACKMEMELPAWQLMAGGIGIPKTKRFLYSADGRPLEEVMGAIGSNRMDPERRPVILVLERRESDNVEK